MDCQCFAFCAAKITLISAEECPGDVSGAVSSAEADRFLETSVAAAEKEPETNQPEGTEDLVCFY